MIKLCQQCGRETFSHQMVNNYAETSYGGSYLVSSVCFECDDKLLQINIDLSKMNRNLQEATKPQFTIYRNTIKPNQRKRTKMTDQNTTNQASTEQEAPAAAIWCKTFHTPFGFIVATTGYNAEDDHDEGDFVEENFLEDDEEPETACPYFLSWTYRGEFVTMENKNQRKTPFTQEEFDNHATDENATKMIQSFIHMEQQFMNAPEDGESDE